MTNLSRLVTRLVSCEGDHDVRGNVHKYGMDLLHMYLVSVLETRVSHLTHILHIFFTGFDERYCILDPVW